MKESDHKDDSCQVEEEANDMNFEKMKEKIGKRTKLENEIESLQTLVVEKDKVMKLEMKNRLRMEKELQNLKLIVGVKVKEIERMKEELKLFEKEQKQNLRGC